MWANSVPINPCSWFPCHEVHPQPCLGSRVENVYPTHINSPTLFGASSAKPPSLMSSRNDTLCCGNPGCRVNHLVWIISYILNLLCLGHAISLNSQQIHTQALNVWYIYLHFWWIFMAYVDKWDRNLYNFRWFFLSSISFFKPLNGRPVPRRFPVVESRI